MGHRVDSYLQVLPKISPKTPFPYSLQISLVIVLFQEYALYLNCFRRLEECRKKDFLGEGNGTPPQHSCLENPMDRGSWQAAVHEVAKSWTQLSDFTLTFHFHAREKEMATHSSVLAWRIPGTGEAGGLPSWGRTELDTTEATQQQQQQQQHS